jgi:hypothetical protein
VAELEADDDVGDAAEQDEEADPEDQQRRSGREGLLRGPESDDDFCDSGEQAEPPARVDVPG